MSEENNANQEAQKMIISLQRTILGRMIEALDRIVGKIDKLVRVEKPEKITKEELDKRTKEFVKALSLFRVTLSKLQPELTEAIKSVVVKVPHELVTQKSETVEKIEDPPGYDLGKWLLNGVIDFKPAVPDADEIRDNIAISTLFSPRTREGFMRIRHALAGLLKAIDTMAWWAVADVIASIAQTFGINIDFGAFCEVVTESLGEMVSEAFSEIIDWWVVNPISNFFRYALGGEWMDDDEIKDASTVGLFTPDTLAYWAARSGLSNSAAVGEVGTGLAYDTESNARTLMTHLNNVILELIEVRTRLLRRLLLEADTRTIDALRWASRIVDRSNALIFNEARRLYKHLRDYRQLKYEWELIKDDPTYSESEKNTIANMLATLEEEIPRKYGELLTFIERVRKVRNRLVGSVSEIVSGVLKHRERISKRYEKQMEEIGKKCLSKMESLELLLEAKIRSVISTLASLRNTPEFLNSWRKE